MKKELDSAEEALVFVAELIGEQKWLILPAVEQDGRFIVEWIEHKSYTALDGQDYPDELWITEAGVPLLVQEMSDAHVRNAFRMILRNQRIAQEGLESLTKLLSGISEIVSIQDELDSIEDITGNESDDEVVRNLKEALDPKLAAQAARDEAASGMEIPATAVKGTSTLQ